MSNYENALRQLDELIAALERDVATEQQSFEILRLKTLKRMLVASDQAMLDKIDRYYQRHISK
ncbi:branched-chain amino acid ABC transporter [Neisseria sp.]|uniref:branched-chain amino acid ABC transporter n=1 Tax=Neisseria sp. TaxID=192066 RepID=UPI00289832E1|nr:branched-chain amino acid ABC transporter [Neisseria sp.]